MGGWGGGGGGETCDCQRTKPKALILHKESN